jgi:hypothetical protein
MIADRDHGAGHLSIAAAGDGAATADEYQAGGRCLDGVLATLAGGELGHPDVDLTVAVLVAELTHLWARWLRGFAESSPGYLIDGLIRRPGAMLVSERRVEVHLPARPLDVVLRMAGYADELETVPWLGERSLAFRLGDGK